MNKNNTQNLIIDFFILRIYIIIACNLNHTDKTRAQQKCAYPLALTQSKGYFY